MQLGTKLNSPLFEAFLACDGDWKKSKFYISIKQRKSKVTKGKRRWMVYTEMVQKYGEKGADLIRTRKLGEPELRETEVRHHPEAPGEEDRFVHARGVPRKCFEDMVQYLCLDDDMECDRNEQSMSYLFEARASIMNCNRAEACDESSSSCSRASSSASSHAVKGKKAKKVKKNKAGSRAIALAMRKGKKAAKKSKQDAEKNKEKRGRSAGRSEAAGKKSKKRCRSQSSESSSKTSPSPPPQEEGAEVEGQKEWQAQGGRGLQSFMRAISMHHACKIFIIFHACMHACMS